MEYETKATCRECDGEGEIEHPWLSSGCGSIVAESPPDPVIVECEHCGGEGECACDDCISDAAEAAYERRCEDFYGASTPQTMDEQHRAAWAQKQELRR
jgi:hypothetical protein